MSESDKSVDPAVLRPALRRAVERLTGEVAAERSGVSRDTIYRVLRGDDASPRTLAKLSAFVEAAESESDKSDTAGQASTTDRPVTMSEREYGRVIGTLETMGRWVVSLANQAQAVAEGAEAMGSQLRALREQLDGLGHSTADATAQLRSGGQLMPIPSKAAQEAAVADALALGRTVPRRGPGEADAAKAKEA